MTPSDTFQAPASPTGRNALHVEVEDRPESSAALVHVTVPHTVVSSLRREVVSRASQQANLPGFRSSPPEEIVINQMGRENASGYMVEYLLKATMPSALSDVAPRAFDGTEQIITPYADIATAFSGPKLETISDAQYTVSVTVAPPVRWHKEAYQLDGMAVEAPNAGGNDRIEADARKAVEAERHQHAQLRVIQDRGLQHGDVAILDMQAERVEGPEEADPILNPPQNGFELDTSQSDSNLPGFVEALSGMQTGEDREFELTFPEDWSQTPLRNVRARFHARLRELFERSLEHLPEISDAELEQARSQATQQRDAEQDEAEMAAAENKLLELSEVGLPEAIINMVARQMFGERLVDLQMAGKIPPGQIEEMVTEERIGEFLKENSEYVEREAKRQLVVQAYADANEIVVPEDVMERETKEAKMQLYGEDNNQQYSEEDLRERVHDVQLRARALDHMRERVQMVVSNDNHSK